MAISYIKYIMYFMNLISLIFRALVPTHTTVNVYFKSVIDAIFKIINYYDGICRWLFFFIVGSI